MPFVTEELYQALPGSAETIMTQSWPTVDDAHNWPEEEEAFEKVMDYIKAVRTMRTEMNVHPAKKTSMIIETADAAPFQNAQVYLAKFAFATEVTFTEKYEGSTDGMVQVSTHAARGFIPMMELIDRDKELARLNKEKAKAEKEMAMFENQLNNPKFVERAPAALVEDIRAKHAKSQDKLANIEQSIKALVRMQQILRVLGLNGAAHHLTMHIVRKLAHFCEYMLEGFLLMLCLRVYTRHLLRHVSWPILGGLLTALTDETVQLFVPGRSGQVTDIWIDFSGVMTGLMVGLILLGLIRMCILLYKHRNED